MNATLSLSSCGPSHRLSLMLESRWMLMIGCVLLSASSLPYMFRLRNK